MEENEENIWEVSEVVTNSNEEDKVYTKEEVDAMLKKHQSDTDKGVQKLLSKTKAYENVLDVVGKVSDDPAYLVECWETNQEVAKIILDKYYNGQSIDDFKRSIDYAIDYNDPVVRKRYFEIEAQRINDEKVVEQSTSSFISKLNMSDDEKTRFLDALEERKQLKSFKISDLDRHLEKAYKEVNDNTDALSKLKSQEAIARAMETGVSWGGGGGIDSKQKTTGLGNEVAEFLKKYS